MWWKQEQPAQVKASFSPKGDITVSELAEIVKGLIVHNSPVTFMQESWDALPARLKRHFWPIG